MKNTFNFIVGGLVLALCLLFISISVAKTVKAWPPEETTIHNMEVGDSITLTNEVYHEYEPEDFRQNYGIDLKPDGYLIYDNNDGEVYYVPFDELEQWFIEMNM